MGFNNEILFPKIDFYTNLILFNFELNHDSIDVNLKIVRNFKIKILQSMIHLY